MATAPVWLLMAAISEGRLPPPRSDESSVKAGVGRGGRGGRVLESDSAGRWVAATPPLLSSPALPAPPTEPEEITPAEEL